MATASDPIDRVRSDFDLNPGMQPDSTEPLEDASVLVPLIVREDGLHVLLTQRTSHLARHAGQISFPGGRREPGDPDAAATALRETEEEIGLPPDRVRLIGQLHDYVTRTGYRVTPLVGLIHPPFPLCPDPHEVAEIFEVPLAFIVDPASHQRGTREHLGVERQFYVLPYQNRYIWGATAGMLVSFARLLRPPAPA